jgi:ubiquinone/menaquinone biosynthesis C-methylase UbiE
MEKASSDIGKFYDKYWPANVPDYEKVKKHVFSVVPRRRCDRIFDAGCGSGICSIVLSELANVVVGYDISADSLKQAKKLAREFGETNIHFCQGSLVEIPFPDESFDLVYCYGVLMFAPDCYKTFGELARILRSPGNLIFSFFPTTRLTAFHEMIRKVCVKMPAVVKKLFLNILSSIVNVYCRIAGRRPGRDYGLSVKAKIEDWYFVPQKRFLKREDVKEWILENNLEYFVIDDFTGRFKSTSSVVICCSKKTECP